ncbi:type VI secretion system membrane subunit TssM [Sorangium sp. So ce1182]|uniref:type VI secretion system membrane subunit TssM n=1 Tax=Sorangium sp. So ce1182 TaxID=3133334 RepID=UPI003F61AB03
MGCAPAPATGDIVAGVLWVLFGLLLLITWAAYFTFGLSTAIPIAASVVIALAAVALFAFRRFRARRAASALERAIVQQGAQQALNARPERRAEIQELQRQVQGGISALKSSKLGKGKKHGSAALYSLPWYVIIGPPGAGKTTALKHSGLVFPYAHPSNGGGVRGVGGTRNCDWWFTNEAILLDTAGRYTTEQDDHEEWIAFLQMLLRHRARRPLNGILVAVSVADLIDASEQHIEQMGKKLRARIDEVMTQLHMVLPVYILFTKCDLIAGFSEFFGDMRRSDRAQAWGATLKLSADKSAPGRLFDAEFDALAKQIHGRTLKRLVTERSREVRERVYQFPLEFAGIRRNLSDLVSTVFMVNAFQGTPIFRGFYFTSGTQEGRPLDRVLQRMGQAMGIRTQEAAAQQNVESKSYFLHDVFMNVVFPDGDIAARSASEIRRQRVVRGAISAAAATLGVILAIPSFVSFSNNREFLRDVEADARAVSAIRWEDTRPLSDKLAALRPALDRLQEIDKAREDGPPDGKGWTMFQGETVYPPLVHVYVASLQNGFVIPCKQRLEDRLKLAKGEYYLRERNELKLYLMLSDVEHLEVDWAKDRFTSLWAEVLRPTSNLNETDLKKQLESHVEYYLTLIKQKRVTPIARKDDLVASVRATLQAVPVRKRYYDFFVNAIIEEKHDPTGDNSRANRKYPPHTLGDMFADRPDVLKVIGSKLYAKEKRWKEIDGPYTEKGHFAVLDNLESGAERLLAERWVVELAPGEETSVNKNLDGLAADYDARYIAQWTDWMADLTVRTPANLKEAKEIYMELAKPDYPYLRIIRALEDNTQWKRDRSAVEDSGLFKLGKEQLGRKIEQKTRVKVPLNVKLIRNRPSSVPDEFKRTVEFGVPTASSGSAPITDTPLARYVSLLSSLRDEIQRLEDVNPNVDARLMADRLIEATRQADALLQPFDERAKTLLRPLLLTPLQVVAARLPPLTAVSRFSGAAAGPR